MRKRAYRVLLGKLKKRKILEDLRIDERNNMKTDLQQIAWEAWNGLIWLRKGTGVGLFKRGNEHSDCIHCGYLLV
jgi:hypothetical protein